MPIPVHTIYGLIAILGLVGVISFLFSWSASKGNYIISCKGNAKKCGCSSEKKSSLAEKIRALIQK